MVNQKVLNYPWQCNFSNVCLFTALPSNGALENPYPRRKSIDSDSFDDSQSIGSEPRFRNDFVHTDDEEQETWVNICMSRSYVTIKDLFINNRSRTLVALLLFCFNFLWISLYMPQSWVEFEDELSWLFTKRFRAFNLQILQNFCYTHFLNFHVSGSPESYKKNPTQLTVKPNSSSWHIIVTLTIPILVFEINRVINNTVCCLIALTCHFIFRVHPLLHCGARKQSKSKRNLVLAQEFQSGH